jgi:hypothetical protein
MAGNRVIAYDSSGGLLATWGTFGTEPGQFYARGVSRSVQTAASTSPTPTTTAFRSSGAADPREVGELGSPQGRVSVARRSTAHCSTGSARWFQPHLGVQAAAQARGAGSHATAPATAARRESISRSHPASWFQLGTVGTPLARRRRARNHKHLRVPLSPSVSLRSPLSTRKPLRSRSGGFGGLRAANATPSRARTRPPPPLDDASGSVLPLSVPETDRGFRWRHGRHRRCARSRACLPSGRGRALQRRAVGA